MIFEKILREGTAEKTYMVFPIWNRKGNEVDQNLHTEMKKKGFKPHDIDKYSAFEMSMSEIRDFVEESGIDPDEKLGVFDMTDSLNPKRVRV